jgi:hypothetical protein
LCGLYQFVVLFHVFLMTRIISCLSNATSQPGITHKPNHD